MTKNAKEDPIITGLMTLFNTLVSVDYAPYMQEATEEAIKVSDELIQKASTSEVKNELIAGLSKLFDSAVYFAEHRNGTTMAEHSQQALKLSAALAKLNTSSPAAL